MAKRLRIMAVCGFGVGTSVVLKMKLEEVLSAHGINADLFTADATTAPGERCDIIFTSRELARSLAGRKAPVVVIENFLNVKEIEEKGIPVVQQMLAQRQGGHAG